ncbi:MAG: copper chaperone PCu(A)C [Thiohalomonadaceae bacterium]
MRKAKAILLGAALFASAASAAEFMVKDPWIRESPPNALALGAFATLHNGTDQARTVVAARSAVASKVELHQTVMEDSLAKMVPQEKIEIAPGGEVKLQPGGLHIMLIGPKIALRAGDRVEVVLEFEDGATLPVNFEVRKGQGMAMDHGHMSH